MNWKSLTYFSRFMVTALFKGQVTPGKLFKLSANMAYAFLRIPRAPYGPAALWVEPVNYCNLRCAGCWVPAKQAHVEHVAMPLEDYKRHVDSVKDSLMFLILQMSGEPFLHPDIFKMIRYAADNRIAVWTSTNGSYKTPEDWGEQVVASGLDTLYISISGATQDNYGKYHRCGNLDNVRENVRKINAAKERTGSKTPRLAFRALLTPENRHELPDIRKMAEAMRVDLHPRYVNTDYVYEGTPRRTPTPEEIEITAKHEPQSLKNHCHGLWVAPALTSDQRLLPCCYDWLYPPTMAALREKGATVRDGWSSPEFNAFRREILKNRAQFSSCRYCDNSLGFKDSFSERPNVITIAFKGHD